MQRLLHPVNSTSEIPDEAYRVCCMSGTYFYIRRQDYNTFCNLWIPHNEKIPLTMQLYSTPHHALYFDLDFTEDKEHFSENQLKYTLETFETNLKLQFFPHLYDFTIIYAIRPLSFGVHVHLPEFTIAHDDYLELCKRLQSSGALPSGGPYRLDAPINWSFPGVGKPNTEAQFYMPFTIKYFTEDETISFDCVNFVPKFTDAITKKFKRVKKNSDSIFRKLLSVDPAHCKKYFYQLMMPIVVEFKPRYKISYITTIADSLKRDNQEDFNDVATISYYFEGKTGYVLKSQNFSFEQSSFLRLYQFFQYRSVSIKNIETDNSAINNWYKMFASSDGGQEEHSIFGKINLELRLDNPIFRHDRNPLERVLKYDHGYYFLPVFFALVKFLGLPVSEIVYHLRPILVKAAPEFRNLLEKLKNLNEEYVKSISSELTLNTILFCAHNIRSTSDRETKTFQEKLVDIVEKSKFSILGVSSSSQMSDLLLKIQERYFPLKVIVPSNMTGAKPVVYVWNALKHSWKEVHSEKERYDHIVNLWTTVKNFLSEYRSSGGIGGPESDVIDKLNLNSIVSTQSSNKSMEVEKITMDNHNWFVRLKNGCMLDLLTGHVGGVVPEFYLSGRTVNVTVPRPFQTVVEEGSLLKSIYNLMIDKEFFTIFLKSCLTNETDDIYDTAVEIVCRKGRFPINWQNDYCAVSMLRFYVHLCKLTSFEYDLLMYLLDVLASAMIATNYKRKFFVCKGDTNNGKSMLFEIVGKTFGHYYCSVLSDNLQKSKNSSTSAPSPDLALTLFTCRIVAMEELENFSENRIKQITGRSRVAFRSLFASSHSAVPTAKVFVTTNNVPDCLVTQAFRERVVAIPFNSTFVEKAPITTAERVIDGLYPKEEYVIEKSYEGCFYLLYLHVRNNIDLADGLIHYRPEPPCVREFTEDYLINTDVYLKFKCHMDVQIVPGSMTTKTDLESAIREFLKEIKAPLSYEVEIKIKFEREYQEYRRVDDKPKLLTNFGGIFSSTLAMSTKFVNENLMEEEDELSEEEKNVTESEEVVIKSSKRKNELQNSDEPLRKRKCKSDQDMKIEDAAIYYEDVIIKKLKKSAMFEN